MLEHVLNRLLENGWSINKLNNEWIYASEAISGTGLLFTQMLDPNQKLFPPIQNLIATNNLDIIILCPTGFNSLFLKNVNVKGFQCYFWDIRTDNLFPYPPIKQTSLLRIKNLLEGKPFEFDITNKPLKDQKSRPVATYILMSIIIVLFIVMTLLGGTTNIDVLVKFGAKVNSLIDNGQYWRLFTSIFIHIGILHLIFNCYALWILGPFVENLFGWAAFLVIFLLSGLGGSAGSYIFSVSISAGASGAIFGLLSALLVYSIKQPKLWKAGLGKNVITIIILNFTFGFFQSGIDNYAHVGGLLSGLVISWIILALKNTKKSLVP